VGSLSTVENEEELYDAINGMATEALQGYGLPFYYKDALQQNTSYPAEYVYIEQTHGPYDKKTLAPGIYDVDAEIVCEIVVSHGKLSTGRQMSKHLQRAFLRGAAACRLVVTNADATDVVLTSGHKFIVAMTLTYRTRVS